MTEGLVGHGVNRRVKHLQQVTHHRSSLCEGNGEAGRNQETTQGDLRRRAKAAYTQ